MAVLERATAVKQTRGLRALTGRALAGCVTAAERAVPCVDRATDNTAHVPQGRAAHPTLSPHHSCGPAGSGVSGLRLLYRQFGADSAKSNDEFTIRNFRTDCLRELNQINRAWPNLHYHTVTGRWCTAVA